MDKLEEALQTIPLGAKRRLGKGLYGFRCKHCEATLTVEAPDVRAAETPAYDTEWRNYGRQGWMCEECALWD